MTLQTRMGLSLGGLLFLLVLVAVAGFLGSRTIGGFANYYATGLVPGVQNYGEMLNAAQELKLHVYQQDFDGIEESLATARRTVEILSTSAGSDSPFAGNEAIGSRIRGTAELMDRLVNQVADYQPGDPISAELEATFTAWDDNRSEAEFVINRIIEIVGGRIQNVLSLIINIIAGVAIVSVVIFVLVAWSLSRTLKKGISSLLGSFSRVADGDLTTRAEDTRKDEFGQLARHFNTLAISLAETLGYVSRLAAELNKLSAEFSRASQNYSERARVQSEETQQVATAMTEMSATIREVAQNAEETAHRAQDANGQADQSRNEIRTAVGSAEQMQTQMQSLSADILSLKDQTDAISVVVQTINDIAEQTNLLALNAAIEAARAGDQGRGFAVVADEVRNLSVKTAESTQEIEKVIVTLQKQGESAAASAESGVAVVNTNTETIVRIGDGLQQILDAVGAISAMNETIATTSEEQSKVAEDMNTNVVRISDLSQENATETEHLVEGIGRIDEMTRQLNDVISRYQV